MKLLRLLDMDHHELRKKCNTLEGERDYYKDLFESGIIQEFFEVIRDKEKVENQKKTIARLKEKIEYFKNEVSELKENKNKNKNKGGNK